MAFWCRAFKNINTFKIDDDDDKLLKYRQHIQITKSKHKNNNNKMYECITNVETGLKKYWKQENVGEKKVEIKNEV